MKTVPEPWMSWSAPAVTIACESLPPFILPTRPEKFSNVSDCLHARPLWSPPNAKTVSIPSGSESRPIHQDRFRVFSSPDFFVGSLADTHGFSTAFSLLSAAFAAGAITWIWLPETRGRKLT